MIIDPTTLPGPLRLPASYPFAGRVRELETLVALLPRGPGEGRRAALVSGEPGSGKSRLLRELAGRLADDGATVLYGACDAVVGAPYGPFVEALDGLVRVSDPADVRADAGTAAPELARILPAAREALGDPPPPAPADADAERLRLHSAVTGFLAAAAARAPLVLVLEDVHWADTPSLLLLRHLLRTATDVRLLVVVTFRDLAAEMSRPLAETLADLARAEGVVRIRLEGLPGEDVAEFVRLATGVEPELEVVEAISGPTDGNAFLLTELWRELVGSERLEVGATAVRLRGDAAALSTPEAVRDVIGDRVARLDATARDVVELGALLGATFDLETVAAAAALDRVAALGAADEAGRHGLVEEAPGARVAYRFTHELVRLAVVDRISLARRTELHHRVARALESTPGSGEPRQRLAALAHHFARAAGVGGREQAVAYNLLAAESASSALAYDEAVERLRTALELGIDDPAERGGVWLDLGYANHRAGRALDALAAFRSAAATARAIGDDTLLAEAAIGFEEACWRPAIHDEGAVELLGEAVAALGDAPTAHRVRLLAALARALDFQGAYEPARVVRDEATGLARALGDRAALGWVLSSSYWSHGARSFAEIDLLLTEAVEIGEELDDVAMLAESLWWLVPAKVALCDHAGARVALDRLFAVARALNEPFRMHVAEHYASALALCDGDLVEAEAAATRSHDWSKLFTGRDASGVYGIQMFELRRQQGRLGELAPFVRLLGERAQQAAWDAGLVALQAELGMTAEARAGLTQVLAEGVDPRRHRLWLGTLCYLADACTLLREPAAAAEILALLEPYRAANVQIGHLVACHGAADRYLGMLSATLGEWEAAEEALESALSLNEHLGAVTWVAHTRIELGRMLLARGGAHDRESAAAHLGVALALAERHALEGVRMRLAELGTRVEERRIAPAPDGLSAREIEILGLVAVGLSNREIGTRLHISEHTAANHVRAILRKTRCANRTEAAAYAHRRGLASS